MCNGSLKGSCKGFLLKASLSGVPDVGLHRFGSGVSGLRVRGFRILGLQPKVRD